MTYTEVVSDADDTSVSVSLSMDNWLPIAAVVVVCGILACVAVRCLATDTSGSTQTMCKGGALLLIVVIIIIIAISIYRRSSSSSSSYDDDETCAAGCDEAFADYEWGYDGFAHKNAVVPTMQRIVGPNPTDNTLNTWQYNPQNTLVDYRFYTTPPSRGERVAPVTRPAVGVRNLPKVPVNDRLGATSTRRPDANGQADRYVLQHPASMATFPYTTTNYIY